MKGKMYKIIFGSTILLFGAFILSSCGGNSSSSGEKQIGGLYVNTKEGIESFITYGENVDEKFSLDDFIVKVHYVDGTEEEIKEGVSFAKEGEFDVVNNTGKFIFTYKDAKAEMGISVSPKSLKDEDIVISGIEESYQLTSLEESIKPEITVSWGGKTLVENVDYELSYGSNDYYFVGENQGQVSIHGIGNFTDYKSESFDIIGVTSNVSVSFEDQTFTYNHVDDYTLPYEIVENLEGVNYVYYRYSYDDGVTWEEYPSSLDVGTFKIKLCFEMDLGYEELESIEKTITIIPEDISTLGYNIYEHEIDYDTTDILLSELVEDNIFYLYIGDRKYDDTARLVLNRDYELDVDYQGFTGGYKNNRNASTDENKAYFAIKGKGNYSGSRVIEFNINPLDVDSSLIKIKTFDADNFIFDGKEKTPLLELYHDINGNDVYDENEDVLLSDTYTTNYYYNIFPGQTSIVSCSFFGNYKGSYSREFEIKPYILNLNTLRYDSLSFTFNTLSQGPVIDENSFENFLDINESIAHLFKTDSNPDGVYYFEYDYRGGATVPGYPNNATYGNNYHVATNLRVDAEENYSYYYNALQLYEGSNPVPDNEFYGLFEATYVINKFVVNNENSIHRFVEDKYNSDPSAVYTGEKIYHDSEFIITFHTGNTVSKTFTNEWNLNAGEYDNLVYQNYFDENYTFADNLNKTLKFTIKKAEIEKGSEENYFKIPEITAIKGDSQTSFQIADFQLSDSQVENEYNKCEFKIVGYDLETGKLEVKLNSNNYNMDHTIFVAPTYKTLQDLHVFGKVQYSTSKDALEEERIDVSDTFFDDFQVDAGYYWLYFGERDSDYTYLFSQSINQTCEYSLILDENNNSLGLKLGFEEGEYLVLHPRFVFEPYDAYTYSYYCNLSEQTYYCGTNPNSSSLVTTEGIRDVNVLTCEKLNVAGNHIKEVYMLYSLKSGEKYGTDYAFGDFYISSSYLSIQGIHGGDYNPYVGHIIDIYLDREETYLGGLYTSKALMESNDKFDITNADSGTIYAGVFGLADESWKYYSIFIDYSPTDIITTSETSNRVIINEPTTDGIVIKVNSNAGKDVQINDAPLLILDGSNYIKGYLYVSNKGKIIISEEVLSSPIDEEGSEDLGVTKLSTIIQYKYVYEGKEYIIRNSVTINREAF